MSASVGRLPVIAYWGPDLGILDAEVLAEVLCSGVAPLAADDVNPANDQVNGLFK